MRCVKQSVVCDKRAKCARASEVDRATCEATCQLAPALAPLARGGPWRVGWGATRAPLPLPVPPRHAWSLPPSVWALTHRGPSETQTLTDSLCVWLSQSLNRPPCPVSILSVERRAVVCKLAICNYYHST